eukprot:GILI01026439.1.p1 GENE.GILI01026439.1~~GILI01026439.1.p1  ORF type:complete len:370 (-),score=25.96 GILI01026439.1:190-1299(-)
MMVQVEIHISPYSLGPLSGKKDVETSTVRLSAFASFYYDIFDFTTQIPQKQKHLKLFQITRFDMEYDLSLGKHKWRCAGKRGTDSALLALEHGADVNVTNTEGETALHHAIIKDYPIVFQALVENGADIDALTNYHHSPLHAAVTAGKPHLIEALMKNGADDSVADNLGDTVLHYAARSEVEVAVRILITMGANCSVRNKIGETPLHKAVCSTRAHNSRCLYVVKTLLDHGSVDVNAKNNRGETPLSVAAAKRDTDSNMSNLVVNELLAHGSDVDATDVDGDTVLHRAARASSGRYANLAVEVSTSNLHSVNKFGFTPLGIAAIASGQILDELYLSRIQSRLTPNDMRKIKEEQNWCRQYRHQDEPHGF